MEPAFFPSPSPMEIMVIAVIALIVLGPSRLPEAARSLGRGLKEMRESFQGGGDDEREGYDRLGEAARDDEDLGDEELVFDDEELDDEDLPSREDGDGGGREQPAGRDEHVKAAGEDEHEQPAGQDAALGGR